MCRHNSISHISMENILTLLKFYVKSFGLNLNWTNNIHGWLWDYCSTHVILRGITVDLLTDFDWAKFRVSILLVSISLRFYFAKCCPFLFFLSVERISKKKTFNIRLLWSIFLAISSVLYMQGLHFYFPLIRPIFL